MVKAVADKFLKKQPASTPAKAASGKQAVAVEATLPPEQARPVAEVMWQVCTYARAAGLKLTTLATDCVWTNQTMPGTLHTKLCHVSKSLLRTALGATTKVTLFQHRYSFSKAIYALWAIMYV